MRMRLAFALHTPGIRIMESRPTYRDCIVRSGHIHTLYRLRIMLAAICEEWLKIKVTWTRLLISMSKGSWPSPALADSWICRHICSRVNSEGDGTCIYDERARPAYNIHHFLFAKISKAHCDLEPISAECAEQSMESKSLASWVCWYWN